MTRQYITCQFAAGGIDYTYHNDGEPVRKGDLVLVSGKGGNGTRAVTVNLVGVPKPKFDTKPIVGKAPPPEPKPGMLL